jgi:hypothetical protein
MISSGKNRGRDLLGGVLRALGGKTSEVEAEIAANVDLVSSLLEAVGRGVTARLPDRYRAARRRLRAGFPVVRRARLAAHSGADQGASFRCGIRFIQRSVDGSSSASQRWRWPGFPITSEGAVRVPSFTVFTGDACMFTKKTCVAGCGSIGSGSHARVQSARRPAGPRRAERANDKAKRHLVCRRCYNPVCKS